MESTIYTSIKVDRGVLNIIADNINIKESYDNNRHIKMFLLDDFGNAITDKEASYKISSTLYKELFINKITHGAISEKMYLKQTSVDKTCLYKCIGRTINIILKLNKHVIGIMSDGTLAIVSKSALTEKQHFDVYDDYIEPSFTKWLRAFNKCSDETKKILKKKYCKESLNHDIKHIVIYIGDKNGFDDIDNYLIVPKYVYYILHLNDNIIKTIRDYSIVRLSNILRMMELQDFSVNYSKVKFLGSTLQLKNRHNLCISITDMLYTLCRVGNTKVECDKYVDKMKHNINKLMNVIENLKIPKSVDTNKRVYSIWQRAVRDNMLCKEYADNYSLFNHHFTTRLKLYNRTSLCSITEDGINTTHINPANILTMDYHVLNTISNSTLTKYMMKNVYSVYDENYPLYVNRDIANNVLKVIPSINILLKEHGIEEIKYLPSSYDKIGFVLNLNNRSSTLLVLSIRAMVSIITSDIKFKDKSLLHYYVPWVLIKYFKEYSDYDVELITKIQKIICKELGV